VEEAFQNLHRTQADGRAWAGFGLGTYASFAVREPYLPALPGPNAQNPEDVVDVQMIPVLGHNLHNNQRPLPLDRRGCARTRVP